MVNELKSFDFSEKVINSDKPVLVDFWAAWCGPCRMLSPIVDSVSEQYAGKADFYKVNVDEEPALAVQFGIASIPTLIVFKNGAVVGQSLGVQPEGAIKALLEKAL